MSEDPRYDLRPTSSTSDTDEGVELCCHPVSES